MEKNKFQKRRGRRKSVSFNPNHQYVEKSVDEFLKNGGKITRIERINGSYQNFVALNDSSSASADDFLLDN
ncbi:MAG: hypothetical protein GY866_19045 [Proteobacteria bacterium]|nr:hypothetical protein [Pseudomonadota bacterium]